MVATDTSGIRHRIYLAGSMLIRDPNPIQLAPRRWEFRTRVSNLSTRIDRGFVQAGLPNVLEKADILFPYRNVTQSPLLEHLLTVLAIGQPFDVCTFKQVKDVFDGDGATTLFYIQRRASVPVITTIAGESNLTVEYPEYVTRVERYAAPYGSVPGAIPTPYSVIYKTEAALAAGTPASGEAWIGDGFALGGSLTMIASLKVNPAPAAFADVLVVTYVPLYRATVETESGRTFAQSLEQASSFKVSET